MQTQQMWRESQQLMSLMGQRDLLKTLLTYLLTYLRTYLLAYLLSYLLAYLLTYLLTHSLTYLLIMGRRDLLKTATFGDQISPRARLESVPEGMGLI